MTHHTCRQGPQHATLDAAGQLRTRLCVQFVSDDRELQAQQLYKVRAGSSKQGGWSFTRAAYSPAVRLVAPCSAGPDTHQAVAFLGKGKSGYVS